MNIRNGEHYINSFWDLSRLNGCFGGTKIRITDVDGGVERNGFYLYFETKTPGADIPFGQGMFYEGQVNAGNSVLFVWGEVNDPRQAYLVTPTRQVVYKEADWSTLQEITAEWYEWADRQPKRFVYKGVCKKPKELWE